MGTTLQAIIKNMQDGSQCFDDKVTNSKSGLNSLHFALILK